MQAGSGSSTYLDMWGGGTLNNFGVFRKTLTGRTKLYHSGSFSGPIDFNNYGLVDVQTGSLTLEGVVFTKTAGETRLDGGSISSSSALDIQGGILSGGGDVNASVVIRGQTKPGLPLSPLGGLVIHGSYMQTGLTPVADAGGPYTVLEGGTVQLSGAGGVSAQTGLYMDIGVGQHDQVAVTGTVQLEGALNVALTGGVVPSVGDQFVVIDNRGPGQVQGAFAGLEEGDVFAVGDVKFQIGYHAIAGADGIGNDVVITVVDPATQPSGGGLSLCLGF